MASEQAEAMKALIIAFRDGVVAQPGHVPTVEEARAGSEASMSMMGLMPDGVTVTDTTVAGIDALWIEPQGVPSHRVLLYLHGGGYVVLSARSHVRLAGGIGAAAGTKVLSVDYRLAPEHPHPAAVDDAVAAYRWLLAEGYAPQNIAIAGDSAGGGLTVATLVALRDAGVPQPAAAVTLSPWVDLEGTGESMRTKADVDLMVGLEGLAEMASQYVPGGELRAPTASPLYADLHGIAPLYIQVGGDETLLDDSTRLATRAAHAGVDVRLDVFPEMQHVFQAVLGQIPESDDAVARIGQYLHARLG